MLSSHFIASAATALFLVGSGNAAFTSTGKTNVAMYYVCNEMIFSYRLY